MPAGEENGIRGYFLTFTIAYLRDFAMQYHFIAESMETSAPWSKVTIICQKTKDKIHQLCKQKGLKE